MEAIIRKITDYIVKDTDLDHGFIRYFDIRKLVIRYSLYLFFNTDKNAISRLSL